MNKAIYLIATCTIISFISACQQSDSLKLLSQEKITYTHENGFSTCFEESIFVGSKTTSYCSETRAYGVGVNNKNENRFTASSYTLPSNSSGSLEGKWLLIYENPEYGWIRESCLIREFTTDSNMYTVDCAEMPNNPNYFNSRQPTHTRH